jgi:hypothetical protein
MFHGNWRRVFPESLMRGIIRKAAVRRRPPPRPILFDGTDEFAGPKRTRRSNLTPCGGRSNDPGIPANAIAQARGGTSSKSRFVK